MGHSAVFGAHLISNIRLEARQDPIPLKLIALIIRLAVIFLPTYFEYSACMYYRMTVTLGPSVLKRLSGYVVTPGETILIS